MPHSIPTQDGRVIGPDVPGPWKALRACLECFRMYRAGDYATLNAMLEAAE